MLRLEDFGRLPDPKEKGEQGESARELGKSLEFLMLKVAQLETLAELQQTELGMQRELIEKLQKKIDPEEAEVSLAQKQRSSEEGVQEAHDVLKRVIQKHAHQRLPSRSSQADATEACSARGGGGRGGRRRPESPAAKAPQAPQRVESE